MENPTILNSPQPAASVPFARSKVRFWVGAFNLKGQYSQNWAYLEWSADNRIRVWPIDQQGAASVNPVLDITPADIKNLSVYLTSLSIKPRGMKWHGFDFSGTDMMESGLKNVASAGLGTLGAATKSPLLTGPAHAIGVGIEVNAMDQIAAAESKSDLQWWVQNLRKNGVSSFGYTATQYQKIAKPLLIGSFIFGMLIGLYSVFSK